MNIIKKVIVTIKKLDQFEFREFIAKEWKKRELICTELLVPDSVEEQINFVYYGLYFNDKIVGYISVWKNNEGTMNRLYVAAEYRRLGIAKRVLKELSIIAAFTHVCNKKAIDFYTMLGFEEVNKVIGKNPTVAMIKLN